MVILLVVGVLMAIPAVSAARTLVVAGSMVGGVTLDGLQAAVEGFNKIHPDVEVLLHNMAVDAIPVAVAGGAPPDVIFVDGPIVSSWALSGILQPVTRYIARDQIQKADFIPPAWLQSEWNGDVWAMAVLVDPNFALLYNRDLFDVAGLDANDPPGTIGEFESAFNRLTQYESNGDMRQIGMVPWEVFGNTNTMYTWGWIFGGDFFDATTQTVTADHPNNIRALEWLRTYYDRYSVYLPSLNSRQIPNQDRFMTALEAMVFSHTGRARDIAQKVPHLEFGIAPMPVHEDSGKSNATWVGGWTLAIPQGARDPDLSWEFIKYITATEEGTHRFAVASGWFPSYLPSPAFVDFREDPILSPFLDIVVNAVHQRPVVPVQEVYWRELDQTMIRVLVDKAPPGETLRRAREIVQRELDSLAFETGSTP